MNVGDAEQGFVDSWNLLIQRATPMAQFTDYFTVNGAANATAVDEKTLEVTLNYPVPFMMEIFSISAMGVCAPISTPKRGTPTTSRSPRP